MTHARYPLALAFLFVAAAAYAQCFIGPDGQRYCYQPQNDYGWQGSGGDYRIGDQIRGQYISQQNQRRSPQGRYVAPLEPQRPWQDARIVKIRNGLGKDGYGRDLYDWGSGAVVKIGGYSCYVLTCAHVTSGQGDEVLVVFNDGRTDAIAECVLADRSCDYAILRLPQSHKLAFELADREPSIGEVCYLAGFPEAGGVRVRQATVSQVGQRTFELRGAAIDGESGGPVVNSREQLVGVIHSTTAPPNATRLDVYTAVCCRLEIIRSKLDEYWPTRPGLIIPRQDQLYPLQPPQVPLYNDPPQYYPPPDTQPTLTPPIADQPPAGPDQPEPEIDWEAWEQQQQEIRSQQAQTQQQLQSLVVKVDSIDPLAYMEPVLDLEKRITTLEQSQRQLVNNDNRILNIVENIRTDVNHLASQSASSSTAPGPQIKYYDIVPRKKLKE